MNNVYCNKTFTNDETGEEVFVKGELYQYTGWLSQESKKLEEYEVFNSKFGGFKFFPDEYEFCHLFNEYFMEMDKYRESQIDTLLD